MKKKTEINKSKLTPAEALSLLAPFKDGKETRIHLMESGGVFMMGYSIALSDLKDKLKTADDICLSGPNMKAMRHGVAFTETGKSYLFLETDQNKLEAIFKKRKIKQ